MVTSTIRSTYFLLIICNAVLATFAAKFSTLTRIDSTDSLMSMMSAGETCLQKQTEDTRVITKIHCFSLCLASLNCSVVLCGDEAKQCTLSKPSALCDKAVNLTNFTAAATDRVEIWVDKTMFHQKHSKHMYGGWTGWSEWSWCSKSCESGSHTRTRNCSDASTQNSGLNCSGTSIEIEDCNTFPCSEACYLDSDVGLYSYNGTLSHTASGNPCQAWNEQTPHSHSHESVGNHSYCRNPDSSPIGPWCYTTKVDVLFEYCAAPRCSWNCGNQPPETNCYRDIDKGYCSYTGTKSTTSSGKLCQAWNSTSPHVPTTGKPRFKHNYCRNPDLASSPWCYTMDSATRWEYCGIPLCT